MSNEAPLHLFGRDVEIPGYLVWGALIYALIGTTLTHLIGRPLVGLNFQQQRFEADFRFNLVRARENSEQIALLHGEEVERSRLASRFERVVENWLGIMHRTKKLTAFTATYSQAAVIFPYVLVAPAYFAGKVQLGGLMQTASAFGSVQEALSFFITAYRTFAEWQSVITRLGGFEASIANAAALKAKGDIIHITTTDGGAIDLEKLLVGLPNGTPLVAADNFSIRHGERTLVTGPLRLRQVDSVSRDCRHLAVWYRVNRNSRQCHDDDAAAAALFSGGHAPGSNRISLGRARIQFRSD